MKIKRLAICAHPDDAEIFAINAIAKGDFALVVMSDGAGCAKGSGYEKMTAEQLKELRKAEQQEAAEVGGYKRLYMLGLTSEKVREGGEKVEAILSEIIDETTKYTFTIRSTVILRISAHFGVRFTRLKKQITK